MKFLVFVNWYQLTDNGVYDAPYFVPREALIKYCNEGARFAIKGEFIMGIVGELSFKLPLLSDQDALIDAILPCLENYI